MAADEAGMLTALKAIRREPIQRRSAEHQGRPVKAIGDGTLMRFRGVADVVRFAVAMQEAMAARDGNVSEDRRITCRTASDIGDIIVEGDNIYRAGVYVAARPETPAELKIHGAEGCSTTSYEVETGRI